MSRVRRVDARAGGWRRTLARGECRGHSGSSSLPSNPMRSITQRSLTLLAAAALAAVTHAQRRLPPQPCVLQDVRLEATDDAPHRSIVVRDGRIEAILEDPRAVVPGAWIVDGEGLLALPAFIDAYTDEGCETPVPVADRDAPAPLDANVQADMREANRKGIQPSFRAADALSFEKKQREAWWKAGFGVAHVAPSGQLLAGRTVVACLRDAAPRDAVLRADAFASASFHASGPGYPSTLMGSIAQLRQFFRDAERHQELTRRRREGRPGPRPAYDADLDVAADIQSGVLRLLALAEDSHDAERWVRLATEVGLAVPPVLTGGRDTWQVAGLLREAGVPLVLTLDWGEEPPDPDAKAKKAKESTAEGEGAEPPQGQEAEQPESAEQGQQPEKGEAPEKGEQGEGQEAANPGEAGEHPGQAPAGSAETVWEYEEPLGVRRERRRLWEERRANALRLAEEGIPFAFGSALHGPKTLIEKVRELVEAGLPTDAALAALTTTPAQLLGLEKELGRLAPGYGAHIAVWTRPPFEKGAEVRILFVDGEVHTFEPKEKPREGAPAEGVDASGAWTVTFESEMQTEPATLVLEMDEDGTVTGRLSFYSRFAQEEVEGDLEGSVSGRTLHLESDLEVSGFKIRIAIEGDIEGDTMEGRATWQFSEGEQSSPFSAVREPQREGNR